MIELSLMSAYGRNYNTDEDMLKDWNEGKDFKIYPNGPYTSIRDIGRLKCLNERVSITRDFFTYKVL